jgi:hypothetical protein
MTCFGLCVKPGALCPSYGEIETLSSSQAILGRLFSHRLPMVM